MSNIEKYLFQPRKLREIIDSAKVVVDTNVLLAAYQYRNITFSELISTLENLNQQGRLLIPSHVLDEFFRNRPNRIVEMIQKVQQVRDGLQNIKCIDNIEMKIPSLQFLTIHEQIISSEGKIKSLYQDYAARNKEYKDCLTQLITELKGFFNDDPILNKYKMIFKENYYKPSDLDEEDKLIEQFRLREKKGTPPGYKDNTKEKNESGDYIIWAHILKIQQSDVIFVTADNKSDWVYKDPNGNVISARRELIEEFFEVTNGKTFCVVDPATFIKEFNPTVGSDVIEDLKVSKDLLEQHHLDNQMHALNDESDSVIVNIPVTTISSVDRYREMINTEKYPDILHIEYVKSYINSNYNPGEAENLSILVKKIAMEYGDIKNNEIHSVLKLLETQNFLSISKANGSNMNNYVYFYNY